MLKRNISIIIAFLLIPNFIVGCHRNPAVSSSRKLFDFNWKFYAGTEDPDSSFDFSNWETIDLPHDWSIDNQIIQKRDNDEIGWYQKTFSLPSEWKHKQISIYFEGIDKNPEVFLNGKLLGVNNGINNSVSCNLTHYLNYKKSNNITVRIQSTEEAINTENNPSGIYKHVWLIISDSGQFGPS
jgi:beta-galactosidase